MSSIDIGIELAQRLAKLGKVMKESHGRAALAGAMTIERYAKEDDEIPLVTGFLQSSTYARENDSDENAAEVVSEADYSWYVHMGTEKMDARPYFTNTINNREDEIVEAIKSQIQKDIDKAMGG